jgi:hypothetical protein
MRFLGRYSQTRLGILAGAAAVLVVTPARPDNQYLEIPPPQEARASRAFRYANLSNREALAQLGARHIPYRHATPPLPGVRLPIRLTGPLHGVAIHSSLSAAEREDSVFEILDARLALALDDFCRILKQHDIVELVHFTMYRPPTTTPKDRNGPQTRHPGGLAIDLGALRKRSGQWLAVGPHWPAAVGARTCGRGARKIADPRGRELASIVCEAYDQRIFHYTLTPHFDQPHSDHLHLEIKPEVQWFLVN